MKSVQDLTFGIHVWICVVMYFHKFTQGPFKTLCWESETQCFWFFGNFNFRLNHDRCSWWQEKALITSSARSLGQQNYKNRTVRYKPIIAPMFKTFTHKIPIMTERVLLFKFPLLFFISCLHCLFDSLVLEDFHIVYKWCFFVSWNNFMICFDFLWGANFHCNWKP